MNPLIEQKDLTRKFKKELHANDILLLPYYVASINIEEAYHSRMKKQYTPFPKITLSDIFNRNEKEKQLSFSGVYFEENNKRIKQQKETDLQVIIGNPPYSSGQKSENDANKNTVYPKLHERIEETYVKESSAQLNTALYDSYIKAIRWATDEITDKGGIIGFVHNASLINQRSTAGLRKSLVKEFDSIYCFNLRGNQRTKGELSKKEGGKVFGGSSRTPIAITFLVRKPKAKQKNMNSNKTKIKYLDIGDYLSREKKLEKIQKLQCIKGIGSKWKTIIPDKHGDWINQRDESFYQFNPMGDKKFRNQNIIFDLYSQGVKTNRDTWTYNFNKKQVKQNMKNMIEFYNQELARLNNKPLNKKNIDEFINRNEKKIKWSSELKFHFIRQKKAIFKTKNIRFSSYRPFTKSWVYFDQMFNNRRYQLPKIFPQERTENKVICVSGVGAKTFSVFMTDIIPDVGFMPSGQVFPLYRFDEQLEDTQKSLLEQANGYPHSITDRTLNLFKNHYKQLEKDSNQKNQNKDNLHCLNKKKPESLDQKPQNINKAVSGTLSAKAIGGIVNKKIGGNQTFKQDSNNKLFPNSLQQNQSPDAIRKEDIFYYIYGLLHSEDYREKYKFNLGKSLPHIPLVPEFWEFSKIGKELSDLHLNYENQVFPKEVKVLKEGKEIKFPPNFFVLSKESYAEEQKETQKQSKNQTLPKGLTTEDLKVKKMRIDKNDRSKIHFNNSLTISGIPKEAWEYKINGYSAPKWIVERYQYKKDKKTDLVNDPNTYSDDPAYILKLLLSVITVSLKTRKLVQSLPPIDFDSLISPTDKID